MGQTYIVLGMHRGGTSLTSHMLHVAGIDMLHGAGLQPTKENPNGYFENKFIMGTNDKILRMAGGSWIRPPQQDKIHKVGELLSEDISRLMIKLEKPRWGFKDPRTCLTFPAYAPHVNNVQFILVIRDKECNFKAFKRTRFNYLQKKDQNEQFFNNLYDCYFKLAYDIIQDSPHVIVKFDEFFNGISEIEKLHAFLNTGVPVEKLYEIINPEYRHHG